MRAATLVGFCPAKRGVGLKPGLLMLFRFTESQLANTRPIEGPNPVLFQRHFLPRHTCSGPNAILERLLRRHGFAQGEALLCHNDNRDIGQSPLDAHGASFIEDRTKATPCGFGHFQSICQIRI